MIAKSTQTSEHYTWGDHCDGWHLLKTDSLSVIQERMPPKTEESLHFHQKSQQFFYILKGVATFEVEGETVIVNSNQGLHIKPNTNHRIFNREDFDLEFLVISEPKSHGDRVNL
ncbi:cupin domain-containing protein [Soonwooa sp.]|uniref:cupin domain-containing protein n=1 Tax=Soonwooa sp. TaxID=1938592 RepID=UPI00262FDFDA|nr:cupin domain-containing protein [Soonwooa sp.]